MASLILPDPAYRDSFIEAMDEFGPSELTMAVERRLARSDFDAYLRTVGGWRRGIGLPPGWVPVTTFWLVDERSYIGSTSVRHELNDYLLRWGGHIGYSIRPSCRRRGHGTEICRLVIEEARKLGIERILITCDDDNPGSRKIIERNGGELEDVVPQPDTRVPKRRYWVDVTARR